MFTTDPSFRSAPICRPCPHPPRTCVPPASVGIRVTVAIIQPLRCGHHGVGHERAARCTRGRRQRQQGTE
jgi:hypothetical protein